jgi:hypothetical protein
MPFDNWLTCSRKGALHGPRSKFRGTRLRPRRGCKHQTFSSTAKHGRGIRINPFILLHYFTCSASNSFCVPNRILTGVKSAFSDSSFRPPGGVCPPGSALTYYVPGSDYRYCAVDVDATGLFLLLRCMLLHVHSFLCGYL